MTCLRAIVTVLLLAALVTACRAPWSTSDTVMSSSSSVSTATTQPVPGSPAAQAEDGEAALGERQALLGGGSVVVYAVDPPVSPPATPAGTAALAIDAEICAGSATPSANLAVGPFQFQLELANNIKRPPTLGGQEPVFPATTLAPGNCARGWVTFDLQPGERPSVIAWATGRSGQELEAEWSLAGEGGS